MAETFRYKALHPHQKTVYEKIYTFGKSHGFSDVEIAQALIVCHTESSFNVAAVNGSHQGLFQYRQEAWNDRTRSPRYVTRNQHKTLEEWGYNPEDLEMDNPDHQISVFFADLKQYTYESRSGDFASRRDEIEYENKFPDVIKDNEADVHPFTNELAWTYVSHLPDPVQVKDKLSHNMIPNIETTLEDIGGTTFADANSYVSQHSHYKIITAKEHIDVSEGDTLAVIAERQGLQPSALINAYIAKYPNGDPNNIRPGESIVIEKQIFSKIEPDVPSGDSGTPNSIEKLLAPIEDKAVPPFLIEENETTTEILFDDFSPDESNQSNLSPEEQLDPTNRADVPEYPENPSQEPGGIADLSDGLQEDGSTDPTGVEIAGLGEEHSDYGLSDEEQRQMAQENGISADDLLQDLNSGDNNYNSENPTGVDDTYDNDYDSENLTGADDTYDADYDLETLVGVEDTYDVDYGQERGIDGAQLGSNIGSIFADYIIDDAEKTGNVVNDAINEMVVEAKKIAIQTLGQNVGQIIKPEYVDSNGTTQQYQGTENFDDDYTQNVQSVVVGRVASEISNAILDAPGIGEGMSQEVRDISNIAITGAATNMIMKKGATSYFTSSSTQGSGFTNAVAGYIGNKAADYMMDDVGLEAESEQAAMIGSLGSTVGSAIGSVYGGPVGAAVGSCIGKIAGTVVGNLMFPGSDPPPPRVEITMEWDDAEGEYVTTYTNTASGGEVSWLEPLAEQAAEQMGSLIDMTNGQVANPDNMPEMTIVLIGDEYYLNGNKFNEETVSNGFGQMVMDTFKEIEIEGGNHLTKVALYESESGDLENVYENLQNAYQYESYKDGTAILDASGNIITDEEGLKEFQSAYEAYNQGSMSEESFFNNYSFENYQEAVDRLIEEEPGSEAAQKWQSILSYGASLEGEHWSDKVCRLNNVIFKNPDFDLSNIDLRDLQLELDGERLILTTEEKSEFDEHYGEKQTLVIEDWQNWNHDVAQLRLHDGTQTTLQGLIDRFGVVEGSGPVDLGVAAANLFQGIEGIKKAKVGEAIAGADGDDTLVDFRGDGYIDGGAGNDTIHAYGGDDVIRGGQGEDKIDGGTGIDTILYDDSTESIMVDLAKGEGTGGTAQGDSLKNIENVIGSDHDDVIIGNDADNTLRGGKGDDKLEGGAGDDTLMGGEGDNMLSGGEGADYLETAEGDDVLMGGEGDDILKGGDGSNFLNGEAGDDILETGSGEDALLGGTGDDMLSAGAGDDTLDGGEGDDVLIAGEGDDTLIGGKGADTLIGGEGFDTVDYSASNEGVQVALDWGDKTSDGKGGDAEGDILEGIEKIIGSSLDDFLVGDANANEFLGGDGDDNLKGGAGDDKLIGEAGNDYLTGDEGDDLLSGGEGDDIVLGGAGNDFLFGGSGSNWLKGGEGDDMAVFGGDVDDYRFAFKDDGRLVVEHKDGYSKDLISDVEHLNFNGQVFEVNELFENQDLFETFTDGGEITFRKRKDRHLPEGVESALAIASAAMLGAIVAPYTAESSEADAFYLTENTPDGSSVVELEQSFDNQTPQASNQQPNEPLVTDLTQPQSPVYDDSSVNISNPEFNNADVFGESSQAEAGGTAEESNNDTSSATPQPPGENNQEPVQSVNQPDETFSSAATDPGTEASASSEDSTTESSTDTETVSSSSESTPAEETAIALLKDPVIVSGFSETKEDHSVNLNIQVSNPNPDSNMIIRVAGVPEGFKLSTGVNTEKGIWQLTPNEAVEVSLIPLTNSDLDFVLRIEAIVTDSYGQTASSISHRHIEVDAVADAPDLNTSNTTGNETEVLPLDITSQLTDLDGSESQVIIVEGVPEGGILSKGTEVEPGNWLLQPADLENLQLVLQEHDDRDVTLKVTAVSTESENANQNHSTETVFVTVNPLDETITGTDQDDTLFAGGGSDVVSGGAGDDTIYSDGAFQSGAEVIKAETPGNDTLYGGDGNDVLYGGEGNDILYGDQGSDTLYGGEGDDTLYVDHDDNYQVHGGEGYDTVRLQGENAAVDMAYSEIEQVIGTEFSDVVEGSNNNDLIYGGGGLDKINAYGGDDEIHLGDAAISGAAANFINGGDGIDTLYIDSNQDTQINLGGSEIERFYGSEGNDEVAMGQETDTVDGRGGNNTINYGASDAGVNIDFANGLASGGYAEGDTISNFQNLVGTDFDDTFTGDGANNRFEGRNGNDTFIGGAGNDHFNAGLGNDLFRGGEGDDVFYAGDGNDTLYGGEGNDQIVIEKNFTNAWYGQSYSRGDGSGVLQTSEGYDEVYESESVQFNNRSFSFVSNNGPEANNDTIAVNMNEDGAYTINKNQLFANDYDFDLGDTKQIVSVRGISNCSVSVDGSGNVRFTPSANYNTSNNHDDLYSRAHRGDAVFEYTIRDQAGAESTARVNINSGINPVDDGVMIRYNGVSHQGGSNYYASFTVNDIDDYGWSAGASAGHLSWNITRWVDGYVDNSRENDIYYAGYNTFYNVSPMDGTSFSATGNTYNLSNGTYRCTAGYFFTDLPVLLDEYYLEKDPTVSVSESYEGIQGYAGLSTYQMTFGFHYQGLYAGCRSDTQMRYEMARPFSVSVAGHGYTVDINRTWSGWEPIALDLDGDGLELVGVMDGVEFDISGTGVQEQIGWVSADDGLLVWDQNGNGLADNGQELAFGSVLEDGGSDMDALVQYFDSNQDGVFDSQDEHWNQFAIWQDANQDGVCDDGEMTYLSDSQVAAINLDAEQVEYDDQGNRITAETSYTNAEGESLALKEVYFEVDSSDQQLTEEELEAYIATLEQEQAAEQAQTVPAETQSDSEPTEMAALTDEFIDQVDSWLQNEDLTGEIIPWQDNTPAANTDVTDIVAESIPQNELDLAELYQQADSAMAQLAAESLTIPDEPLELPVHSNDLLISETPTEEELYS